MQLVGGHRKVALEERATDHHVFFWKFVVAVPCYRDSKALLSGTLTRRCTGAWWRRSSATPVGCRTAGASGTLSGRESGH